MKKMLWLAILLTAVASLAAAQVAAKPAPPPEKCECEVYVWSSKTAPLAGQFEVLVRPAKPAPSLEAFDIFVEEPMFPFEEFELSMLANPEPPEPFDPFGQAATPPPAQPAPPAPPAPPEARAFAMIGGKGSYLGVGIADIDSPERVKALKLSEERGVEITRVDQDSPAGKAGLKEGDVVLEYNGQRVEGVEQFQRMVRETPVGRDAKLSISRNGAAQTVTVTIGQRKAKTAFSYRLGDDGKWRSDMEKLQQELGNLRLHMPDMPQAFMSWRTTMLGIEAESLSSQLAEFFGVKEGVLIRTVMRDSAAEKAGLKAGDVITKVDNDTVRSPGEISSKIRSISPRKSFPIAVVRNRGEIVLNVTLEEPQQKPREIGPRPVRAPRQDFKPEKTPRARTAAIQQFL